MSGAPRSYTRRHQLDAETLRLALERQVGVFVADIFVMVHKPEPERFENFFSQLETMIRLAREYRMAVNTDGETLAAREAGIVDGVSDAGF